MKTLRFTIPILLMACIIFLFQTIISVEASGVEVATGVISTLSQSAVYKTIDEKEFNDTCFERQWALPAMRLPANSSYYQALKRQVKVAILDSGIDVYHEDLGEQVVVEKNFVATSSVNDINGHGTHVAGIIAAQTNNSLGIAGIAPSSRIFNVKVADDQGKVYAKVLAEGIVWATQNGADVINISIEIPEPSPELEEAVSFAWENGSVVVAAASNHTIDPVYPAHFLKCIAVAAINFEGQIRPLLHNSEWVDVAAPGYSIYSTLPNNEYGYKSGTSFAAAHVSGLAALLYNVAEDSNKNGKINDEVRAAIETTACEIPGNSIRVIDVASALDFIHN